MVLICSIGLCIGEELQLVICNPERFLPCFGAEGKTGCGGKSLILKGTFNGSHVAISHFHQYHIRCGHFNEDITSERMYRTGSFYIITFSLVTFQKAENSSQRSLASF